MRKYLLCFFIVLVFFAGGLFAQNSLQLDGTNVVGLDGLTTQDFDGSFAVEFWVKADSATMHGSLNRQIISCYSQLATGEPWDDGVTTSIQVWLVHPNAGAERGTLNFQFVSNITEDGYTWSPDLTDLIYEGTPIRLFDNEWHHVSIAVNRFRADPLSHINSAIYDEDAICELYIDGVKVGGWGEGEANGVGFYVYWGEPYYQDIAKLGIIHPVQPWVIGGMWNSYAEYITNDAEHLAYYGHAGSGYTSGFIGQVDEIKLWNFNTTYGEGYAMITGTPLDSAAVVDNMYGIDGVLPDGLIRYHKFDGDLIDEVEQTASETSAPTDVALRVHSDSPFDDDENNHGDVWWWSMVEANPIVFLLDEPVEPIIPAPIITISVDTLDFGVIGIDEIIGTQNVDSADVLIANTGTADLWVDSLVFRDGDWFSVSSPTLPFGLTPGNNTFIRIYVTPAYQNPSYGLMEDSLTIYNNAENITLSTSLFLLAEDESLPVEMTSFQALGGDGTVTLKWSVASELENLGFEVIRAFEKEGDYKMIADYTGDESLVGQGNSATAKDYEWIDGAVFNGIEYWYKIVDVDFAGVRVEHGPVFGLPQAASVDNPEPGITTIPLEFALVNVAPNPFNPSAKVSFTLPEAGIAEMTVYNILGKQLGVYEINGEAGLNKIEFIADNNISSGVLFYVVRFDVEVATGKMVLLK